MKLTQNIGWRIKSRSLDHQNEELRLIGHKSQYKVTVSMQIVTLTHSVTATVILSLNLSYYVLLMIAEI